MIIKSSELERILSAAQIKDLSKRAAEHFAKSADFNIYEDSDVEFKIVKLVDKDKNPIYFLVYQKIGTGSFGEVSRAIKLDIEHGTIASNIEVAIKVTDFTQGGTLGKTNITFAKSVTAHENNVLLRIQQSHGYSVGARKKRVPINLGDELVMQEVEIQEAIVAMTLHSGNDIQHMAHKDKFSFGSIRFLELASKFCTDLEQIHNKGVIHSDLKPANVIWDLENGLVNIVDFNRAKFLPKGEEVVFDDSSSDKNYMAPECFTQREYRYSKAADVYAVGKILLEKFDITNPQTNKKESLQSKYYLSYDQLLIKPFLEQMNSPDVTRRPTLKECAEFFGKIEQKMKLDIEQPNNKLRLQLSKTIIQLEIYVNKLQRQIQKQIKKQNGSDSGNLIVDKRKQNEMAINAIELFTQVLSTPEIDIKRLKEQQHLFQLQTKTNRFFSSRGRYQQIIDDIANILDEQNETDDNARHP